MNQQHRQSYFRRRGEPNPRVLPPAAEEPTRELPASKRERAPFLAGLSAVDPQRVARVAPNAWPPAYDWVTR